MLAVSTVVCCTSYCNITRYYLYTGCVKPGYISSNYSISNQTEISEIYRSIMPPLLPLLLLIYRFFLITAAAATPSALSRLIGGDSNLFFESHWDSSPVLYHNNDHAFIQELLSPTDIYTALRESIDVCQSVELVKRDHTVGGGSENPGKFVTGSEGEQDNTCDFEHFNAAHLERSGATILLPSADTVWENLSKLACDIQGELGYSININTYLSPPNAEGFLLHRDGHDLLIVQTYGTKKWKICEPKSIMDRLSIEGKHFGEGWEAPEDEYRCYSKNLVVGDVLYLPRGTLHQPTTESDIGSMHLSIGIDIRGFRWVDVVTAHLREGVLLQRLSREAMKETHTGRDIMMTQEAFIHPITGDWSWHTLFGAMTRMLPDMKSSGE